MLTRSKARRRPPQSGLQRALLNFHPGWIVGQRLGCLAWAIADADPEQAEAKPQRIEKLAAAISAQLADLQRISGERALIGLPVSVLEICASPRLQERIPNEAVTLATMRSMLAARKQSMTLRYRMARGQEIAISKASQADAADIIAQMILFSDLPAPSLIHALQFFVDEGFAAFHGTDSQARLQEFLDLVRNPGTRTHENATTIHRFAGLFDLPGMRIPNGLFIKNALLDALLAWPLLVFQRARHGRRETSPSSFSLPVLVDLRYDGLGRMELNFGDEEVEARHGTLLEQQMSAAFATAKDLWRSKNGHVQGRRSEVAQASCMVDFRLAAEVCRYTPLQPLWQHRSAEAYFVQVFLAKLIGRHVSMTAALSGTVEESLPERRRLGAAGAEEQFSIVEKDPAKIAAYVASRAARTKAFEETGGFTRDKRMGSIGGHEAKYRFARVSKKYRKLILPLGNRIGDRENEDGSYIEVNYAHSVAVAADAAQLGGWRQHDYVRCPDIGHLIHREPALLPPVDHEFVQETAAALLGNRDNAIWLDDNHTILSVAALLAYLNFEYRFDQPRTAPSLSWSVVRSVSGETDSRFWHILLKAIGASDLAIKEHFLRGDTEYTANLIWSILSGGLMAQQLGCTAAPDLVVVFAARHLRREGMAGPEREVLKLDAERVIAQINRMRFENLRKPFRDVIGRSRIVLLDNDMAFQNKAYFSALPGAGANRDKLFAALSIFKLGFTLQMAQIAAGHLAPNIVHLKRQLGKQVEAGTMWRYGEHYFLPHALRAAKPPPPSVDLAKALKRIANSLMPGLGNSSAGGLAVAECFEPEYCREAQDYLVRSVNVVDEAMSLPENAVNREDLDLLKRTIDSERELHQRFFEMPTWGVLTSLNKNRSTMSRREVLHYALELMDRARVSGSLKPNGYTLVVKATENVLRDAWDKVRELMRTDKERLTNAQLGSIKSKLKSLYKEIEQLVGQIEQLFDEAEAAAEAHNDDDARKDWLVHVLTHRHARLKAIAGIGRGTLVPYLKYPYRQKLADIDRRLLEILKDDTGHGIFPETSWFVEHGDRARDVNEAVRFYRRALHHAPTFLEIYPRIFGVMSRAEYREAMQAPPGQMFWKGKVSEASDWIRRDRQKLESRIFSGIGKERFWKGYAEMLTYLKK